MKKLILIVLSLASFFVISCKKDKTIYFDQSEPLSLEPDISWALITEPYVAFRNEDSWDGEVIGHCRKGDIFRIMGKSIKKEEVWYNFESGWIPESSISVYSNKFKAQTAKDGLK